VGTNELLWLGRTFNRVQASADKQGPLWRIQLKADEALGQIDYGRKGSEQGNVQFRRSLYFVQDMKSGERITSEKVKSIRPGFGLAPKYIDQVMGATVAVDVARGTPVRQEHLK